MDKDQSELIRTNKWVHNFLDDEFRNNISTEELIEGVRSFSTTGCMQIFIGDYILKWSDDGVNKTVYQVTQTDGTGGVRERVTKGTMKDLIAAGDMHKDAVTAIEKGDIDIIRRLS